MEASGTLRTSFLDRFICSIQALVTAWLISGSVFFVFTKGANVISAWCIWGTVFFVLGWILVAWPLVVFGERVRRVAPILLMTAGGLDGALVMALPTIVLGFFNPPVVHWKFKISDLRWEELAFIIPAPTTAFYRLLVERVEARDRSAR